MNRENKQTFHIILIQLISISIYFFINFYFEILNYSEFFDFLYILIITNFLSSLPLSFLGIGVRDISFLALVNLSGLKMSSFDALFVTSVFNVFVGLNYIFITLIVLSLNIFIKNKKKFAI